jgi:hypothetical protein
MEGSKGIYFGTVSAYTGEYRSFEVFKRVEYESTGSGGLSGLISSELEIRVSQVADSAITREVSAPEKSFHIWHAGYKAIHVSFSWRDRLTKTELATDFTACLVARSETYKRLFDHKKL